MYTSLCYAIHWDSGELWGSDFVVTVWGQYSNQNQIGHFRVKSLNKCPAKTAASVRE